MQAWPDLSQHAQVSQVGSLGIPHERSTAVTPASSPSLQVTSAVPDAALAGHLSTALAQLQRKQRQHEGEGGREGEGERAQTQKSGTQESVGAHQSLQQQQRQQGQQRLSTEGTGPKGQGAPSDELFQDKEEGVAKDMFTHIVESEEAGKGDGLGTGRELLRRARGLSWPMLAVAAASYSSAPEHAWACLSVWLSATTHR